jgi:hypothetical protein
MKYILLLLLSFSVNAEVLVNVGAKHFKESISTEEFNEFNPGIGFEHQIDESFYYTGGVFKNSFNETTYYAGGGYRVNLGKFSLGIESGYVNGYKKEPGACCLVENVFIAPHVLISKVKVLLLYNAVGVQLRF